MQAASTPTPVFLVANGESCEHVFTLGNRLRSAGFVVADDARAAVSAGTAPISVLANYYWVFFLNIDFEASPDLVALATRVLLASKTRDHSNTLIFATLGNPPIWALDYEYQKVKEDEIPELDDRIANFINLEEAKRTVHREEVKEIRDRVDQQLDRHIVPVLSHLARTETQYRWGAFAFYFVALFTLGYGLYFALERARLLRTAPIKSWFEVAAFAVGSLVVIGMLTAVARLAFLLGRSFMVESLTNGDRAHAISFGRFYLQAFGDRATWNEVKEAFENWNIDRGSSFASQAASDVDPIVLQVAVEAAKSLGIRAK